MGAHRAEKGESSGGQGVGRGKCMEVRRSQPGSSVQTTGVRTPADSWWDPTLIVRGSQWGQALHLENYSLSIWGTEQASSQARCQDRVVTVGLAQSRGRAVGLQDLATLERRRRGDIDLVTDLVSGGRVWPALNFPAPANKFVQP